MNEQQKDYAVGKALAELLDIVFAIEAELEEKNKQSDEEVSL